jgi:hypothetical protein
MDRKINIVFLKNCAEIPLQLPLSDKNTQPYYREYDWDKCEIYEVHTMDLNQISKSIGARGHRLGRTGKPKFQKREP